MSLLEPNPDKGILTLEIPPCENKSSGRSEEAFAKPSQPRSFPSFYSCCLWYLRFRTSRDLSLPGSVFVVFWIVWFVGWGGGAALCYRVKAVLGLPARSLRHPIVDFQPGCLHGFDDCMTVYGNGWAPLPHVGS